MEWQLPIQKLEIGNVNIGSPWSRGRDRGQEQKPMAPLSYFGTQFRMPLVSILFPPLPILEYNAATGRLILDMSETSLASIKMSVLQETLINAVLYHQHSWFKTEYSKDDIRSGFQPLYQDNHLHFHCPLGTNGHQRNIPVYKNKNWSTLETGDLKAGMRIRVAVKIHGISFLLQDKDSQWTGRCRLQHRIQGVLISSPS
jgi:hypothetical protein